jgi:hypothetical protein
MVDAPTTAVAAVPPATEIVPAAPLWTASTDSARPEDNVAAVAEVIVPESLRACSPHALLITFTSNSGVDEL